MAADQAGPGTEQTSKACMFLLFLHAAPAASTEHMMLSYVVLLAYIVAVYFAIVLLL